MKKDESDMNNGLSEAQGRHLLKVARESIGRHLGLSVQNSHAGLNDPAFEQPCATFVTLKLAGNLRGCIGTLEPSGSLLESIRTNALSAAFHDHRFRPLSTEELGQVKLEISVLSAAEPLEYRDGAELVEKLRVGIDGVILQLGKARATFLPQVWEQLPEPEDFLNHLCQKAGLQASAWRHHHPDIFLYQVLSFKER